MAWLNKLMSEVDDNELSIETKAIGDIPIMPYDMSSLAQGITNSHRINSNYNDRAAIQYFTSWVYAASMIVAEKATATPKHLYVCSEKNSEKTFKTKKLLDSQLRNLFNSGCDNIKTKIMNTNVECEEVVENNPITDLLRKPNEWQTGYEFDLMKWIYLQIFGNAFIYPVMKKIGGVEVPVELYHLNPVYMSPIYDPKPLGHYPIKEWRYVGLKGQQIIIPAEEVIHFRLPGNLLEPWMGYSRMQAAFTAIMLRNGKRESDLSNLFRTAYPSIVFSLKGADNVAINRFETEVGRKLVGASKSSKIMAVNAEDIKVSKIEADKWDLGDPQSVIDEIASVFRVPNSLLQMRSSTEASATVANEFLLTNTIQPMLSSDEEQINTMFIPRFEGANEDVFIAYDRYSNDSIEKKQSKDKRDEVVQLFQAGILTKDEARMALGYDPNGETK